MTESELELLLEQGDIKKTGEFEIKYDQIVSKLLEDMESYQKTHEDIKTKNKSLDDTAAAFETTWYEADPNDKIDQYMADYINAAGRDLEISKDKDGIYFVGGKKYTFQIKSDSFLVRRGCGFDNAHDLLDHHYIKIVMKNRQNGDFDDYETDVLTREEEQ